MVSKWGIIQRKQRAFEQLSNLKQLSLTGTKNDYPFSILLSSNTFKGMKNLTELEIRYNKLPLLHGDYFHELENLEILDLGENSISLPH